MTATKGRVEREKKEKEKKKRKKEKEREETEASNSYEARLLKMEEVTGQRDRVHYLLFNRVAK